MSHNETPADRDEWGDAAPVNDLEALLSEVDQLRATVVGLKEETLRERAELDNQRKRLARDVDVARKFANERLLSDLLPVLDSLDAGLKAGGEDNNALRAGLELTLKQLLKVAGENGLTVVDPLGQPFDPDQHQAISQSEAGAGVAPGTVTQVFQKGYLLNSRLLRPALVVVARHED